MTKAVMPACWRQVGYFAMPLAVAGLATAFKISTGIMAADIEVLTLRPWAAWYHAIGIFSVAVFCIFLVLYAIRFMVFPRKCLKEWDCPLRSPSFGMITLCLMLYAFLWFDAKPDRDIYRQLLPFDGDDLLDNESYEWLARVLFWIGACTHILLTIAKIGEWVGKRLEWEHFHATWLILPVGNLIAALVAPVVPALHDKDAVLKLGGVHANTGQDTMVIFESMAWANLEIARFFYSVGFIMWVVLFTLSFLKTVTTHNSDDRIRHSTFIWVAAPAIISVVEYAMCSFQNSIFITPELNGQCTASLSFFFWFSIIMYLSLCWATLPYINFFGRDQFNMNYWVECFATDTIAVASALYYSILGTYFAKCIMLICLITACLGNLVALLHTIVKILRWRVIFTPELKWGPLSFMKLTHEAFRGALPELTKALGDVEVDNQTSINRFCVLLSQFVIVHEEHSKHEVCVLTCSGSRDISLAFTET